MRPMGCSVIVLATMLSLAACARQEGDAARTANAQAQAQGSATASSPVATTSGRFAAVMDHGEESRNDTQSSIDDRTQDVANENYAPDPYLPTEAVATDFRAAAASSATVLPAARHIDVNGNGRADLFFFDHASGRLVTWFMSGTNRTATSASSAYGGMRFVGSGKFCAGSGPGDDALMDSTSYSFIVGCSNGTNFSFQQNAVFVQDGGAMLIDVADINGDGWADMVLRNAVSGAFTIVYMYGLVSTGSNSTAISPGLAYVAAADFNNDKKADLLFQDSQRNLFIAISSGASFSLQPVGLAYSSAYALRGATDVSGDGSADILLHDASTNKLVVWYMHGATRAAYNSMTPPAGTVLVAHGDFDGNKKSDLAWVHPTSGSVWLSLSNGSAFTTSQLAYSYTSSTGDPMDIDL